MCKHDVLLRTLWHQENTEPYKIAIGRSKLAPEIAKRKKKNDVRYSLNGRWKNCRKKAATKDLIQTPNAQPRRTQLFKWLQKASMKDLYQTTTNTEHGVPNSLATQKET
ncbi:hypothetical protein CEXT_361471 [Caerostris extrusa]|uniref:Uncharacterized protein n=1 Tax=Caerostris extrusa TaxID=172846 RepID=A0AAV4PWC0_CAEEX|nr:hypothetical protein CEXT_361471 [Caerostris extrusa]